MSERQKVVIDGRYTYAWHGEPVAVGDTVLLPENYVTRMKLGPGPFAGTVTALESTYEGPLSPVLRVIHRVKS
jgi:hypothetical protein